MGRTWRLAAVLLLAVCLAGVSPFSAAAESVPEPGSATLAFMGEPGALPEREFHCGSPGRAGDLVITRTTVQVGYQNRPCAHGRLGHVDHRYLYLDLTIRDCTLCVSYSKAAESPAYFGEWIC